MSANSTQITNAHAAVVVLQTSMTALSAAIVLYDAAVTTLANSGSSLATVPDIGSATEYVTAISTQIDAIKGELNKYKGSLTVPT